MISRRCVVLLAALFSCVANVRAEREIEPPEAASHVVAGTVRKVFTRNAGDETEYLVQIRIASVEKGDGYGQGDYIYAYAFQRNPEAPREEAASGHHSVPKEGQRIRARIKRASGRMEALYPFWYDLLEDGARALPTGRDADESTVGAMNDLTELHERVSAQLPKGWTARVSAVAPGLVISSDEPVSIERRKVGSFELTQRVAEPVTIRLVAMSAVSLSGTIVPSSTTKHVRRAV